MRIIIAFLVLAVAIVVASEEFQFQSPKFSVNNRAAAPTNIVAEQITSRLDHFSPTDNRAIQLVYHTNDEFYVSGRPIYLHVKYIAEDSTKWIEEGLMYDIARSNNALLVTMDTRYFGTNILFEDLSWENLKFLTIELVLADYAVLIDHLLRTHAGGNVIVWGAGLGGTLSSWLRLKYPHLVHAVWSSSGIYELDYVTYNYYNALEVPLLNSTFNTCHRRVLDMFAEIEHLIEIGDNDALVSRLNLCNPVVFGSHEDIGSLFETLYDFITDFFDQNHIHGVETFCRDIIFTEGSDAFDAFVRWITFVYNLDGICIDHSYEARVNLHSNPLVTPSERRAWTYLQCTQVGNFKITEPFSWLPNHIQFAYHHSHCNDVLGPNYDVFTLLEAVTDLEMQYGGIHQTVTNIIYVNGNIDPWFFDGITSTTEPTATVINIDLHAKSADLTSINGWDAEALTVAKRRIVDIITNWSN